MNKTSGISARITPATKERLEQYVESHENSKSEVIEQAINYYLDAMQYNVSQDAIQDKQEDVIQDVSQDKQYNTTQDVSHLESRLKKLEDDLQTTQHILEERLDHDKQQFKGYLLGLSCQWEEEKMEEKMEGISCNLPHPKDDTWEPLMTLDEVEDKYGKPHPKVLNQKELAARLGKGSSSLTEARKRGNFSEWSKHHDPDGIAWEYRDKKYHPIPN